jgi:8-oxo-dGTP pyrophosphatase MutT (NUDIX family)
LRSRILNAFDGPGLSRHPDNGVAPWVRGSGRADSENNIVPAAVLVPLVDRPGGMTVLLTQRTDHLQSHAGQISFPGGRVEEHDLTPEDTALRETEEEIGLPRARVELVGRLNERKTGTGYLVVPVVGLIAPPFELVPDPGEVAEVFELPLEFALDPANHKFETRIRGGVEQQFYVLPYEDYYIWGLTARLLVNLAEVIGH